MLERLIDLAFVVEEDSERSPEDSLSGHLLRCLTQQLKGVLRVVKTDHTAALYVQRVDILFLASFLCLLDVLKSALDVAVAETAPSQVLIYPLVFIVQRQGCFKRSFSLLKVFFLFIQQTNLDQGVDLFLDRE